LVIGLTVTTVAMAPMVHKHMHERTGEQWKPNEQSEHVRAVLCEQQCEGNDQKSNQHEAGLGFCRHSLRVLLMPKMILHRHEETPSR
jgi:hypothetical protein